MRLAIAFLVLGALLSGAGGALVAFAVARFLRRIGEAPLAVMVMATAIAGLDVGTLVATVATGGTSPTMAPAVVFGSVATTVAIGLAGATLATGSRGLSAPTMPTMRGTLLPFGALTVVGLVAHDRVVTRGEGLGLLLLFGIAVVATLWERDRTFGMTAAWSTRARAHVPAMDTGSPSEGNAPTPGPVGKEVPTETPAHREGRTLAWLRAGTGRIALTSDLRTPALAAAGLLLAIVGGLLVARGGVRFLDRTSLTAGFVGFALAGGAAGAAPASRVVARVRWNAAKTMELAADVTTAAALFVLGLAGLIHPMVVDAAGAVAFLGVAAIAALAWTVLLVRRTGGRFLALVLLSLAGGLVWAALHV